MHMREYVRVRVHLLIFRFHFTENISYILPHFFLNIIICVHWTYTILPFISVVYACIVIYKMKEGFSCCCRRHHDCVVVDVLYCI